MIRRRGPNGDVQGTVHVDHPERGSATNSGLNVTDHPTAVWTARQLLQACGIDEVPRYLLRDRDAIDGEAFHLQVRALHIEEAPTAPRTPWQNPFVERVTGSIRRECIGHVVVLGEGHLGRILSRYATYYNGARTHLSLY
jgi:hypothetical protein